MMPLSVPFVLDDVVELFFEDGWRISPSVFSLVLLVFLLEGSRSSPLELLLALDLLRALVDLVSRRSELEPSAVAADFRRALFEPVSRSSEFEPSDLVADFLRALFEPVSRSSELEPSAVVADFLRALFERPGGIGWGFSDASAPGAGFAVAPCSADGFDFFLCTGADS
jgi:hypothetical protein